MSDIRHMADTVVGHYGVFPRCFSEVGGRYGAAGTVVFLSDIRHMADTVVGHYGVFPRLMADTGAVSTVSFLRLWQSLAHGQMAATRAHDTSALRRG